MILVQNRQVQSNGNNEMLKLFKASGSLLKQLSSLELNV
jgi:hypothetical protein